MRIPRSLEQEHRQLHAELAEAERAPGRVGEAAREVARILHPHFLREDEYAIPPLGLLVRLAHSRVTADMAEVLPLVARLKDELPLMLEEHKAILGALRHLANVATEENQPTYISFAERLMHHALVEEEILYPAAVVVGECVKLKLQERAQCA